MKPSARLRIFAATLLAAASLSTPAWAPGSLSLEEVLMAVKAAPKLVAEMNAELKKSGVAPDQVICWAGRHGRHWKYLGGMRAAPYSCKIGQREVTIEADRSYFDVRGRNLGDVDHAPPEKAKTFRERNFRWTWSE